MSLRTAEASDRRHVHTWLAKSDVAASMMGPTNYPDLPVPTWDEFCADYLPHFFDDSDPYAGRCFIIVAGEQDVGVVCHNALDDQRRLTEFNVWLRSEADCGRGYGSNALRLLCQRLHEAYGIADFIIRPSKRNRRAIAAYQRAGFALLPLTPEEQRTQFGEGDCEDSVVLLKRID